MAIFGTYIIVHIIVFMLMIPLHTSISSIFHDFENSFIGHNCNTLLQYEGNQCERGHNVIRYWDHPLYHFHFIEWCVLLCMILQSISHDVIYKNLCARLYHHALQIVTCNSIWRNIMCYMEIMELGFFYLNWVFLFRGFGGFAQIRQTK